MPNELATTDALQNFQDKIAEKLRNDIGALLPDDALSKLIERAVEENFFKERLVKTGDYHGTTKKEPSWFVQAVREMTEAMVREHVQYWCAANEDAIKEKVDEFLSREALAMVSSITTARMVRAEFDHQIRDLITQISNKLGQI